MSVNQSNGEGISDSSICVFPNCSEKTPKGSKRVKVKPVDLDKFDAVLNNEREDRSLVAYMSQLRTTLDGGHVVYFCNSCKSALRSTNRLKTRLDSLNRRLACRPSNTNDTAPVRDADHKYCPHRTGDNYCSAYRSLVNADKDGHEAVIEEQIRFYRGKYGVELTAASKICKTLQMEYRNMTQRDPSAVEMVSQSPNYKMFLGDNNQWLRAGRHCWSCCYWQESVDGPTMSSPDPSGMKWYFTTDCDVDVYELEREVEMEREIGGLRRWICGDCYELNHVRTVNAQVLQERIDSVGDADDVRSKSKRAQCMFHLWIYDEIFEKQKAMFWGDALGKLRILYQKEGMPFRNVDSTHAKSNLVFALTKNPNRVDVDVSFWRPLGRRKLMLVPSKSMGIGSSQSVHRLNVVYNTLAFRQQCEAISTAGVDVGALSVSQRETWLSRLNAKIKVLGRELGQYSRWASKCTRQQNENAQFETELEKEMATKWDVSNLHAPPSSPWVTLLRYSRRCKRSSDTTGDPHLHFFHHWATGIAAGGSRISGWQRLLGTAVRKYSFTKVIRILNKLKLVPSPSSVFSSLRRFRRDHEGCLYAAKRVIGNRFCFVTSDNVEKSVKNRQIGSDKPTMARNVSNFAHILIEHEMPGEELRRGIREKLKTLLFDELKQERRSLDTVMLHELHDLDLKQNPRLESLRSDILSGVEEIQKLQTTPFNRRLVEMVDPPEDNTPFNETHFTPIKPLNVPWNPPSRSHRRQSGTGSAQQDDEIVYNGESSVWGGIEKFNEIKKSTSERFMEFLYDVNSNRCYNVNGLARFISTRLEKIVENSG